MMDPKEHLEKVIQALQAERGTGDYTSIMRACRNFKGPCFCGVHLSEVCDVDENMPKPQCEET